MFSIKTAGPIKKNGTLAVNSPPIMMYLGPFGYYDSYKLWKCYFIITMISVKYPAVSEVNKYEREERKNIQPIASSDK